MSEDSIKWSIYHPLKRVQLNALSGEELSLFIASLTPSELYSMWFWCTGWKDWMPYLKAQETHKIPEPKVRRPISPPVPQVAKIKEDHRETSEITEVFKNLARERALVDRKYPRYDIKVPIEVILNEHVYKTQTENVSLGGICTVDALPEWVAGYCTAILHPERGEKIEVICSVVEDQPLESKYRLEIVATVQLDHLRQWMKNQGFEPEKK